MIRRAGESGSRMAASGVIWSADATAFALEWPADFKAALPRNANVQTGWTRPESATLPARLVICVASRPRPKRVSEYAESSRVCA
jgi:hypothetical protein